MNQKSNVTHNYLRHHKKFPNVWCPGCGIGIAMGAMIRAIDNLGLPKDDVAVISGIGCTARIPVYLDFNTLHTTHGRPLAFATGVKMANERLKVIVVSGDGDLLAIGGNHFIHAARRNMDITCILVNNYIYGMTGGQYSPTTPFSKKGSTAPYGMIEQAFDPVTLAKAAGASYIARGTVYHAPQLARLMSQAINKKGFSLVEVISNCHTQYGRLNREGSAVKMILWQKEHSVSAIAAAKMSPEELEGKFVTGVLHDEEKPEYLEEYQKIIDRVSIVDEEQERERKKVVADTGPGDKD
ncbi:MAG: 2-oxoacid:ferredoxin oxidoreductase subunit beta [candidate division Zixibacteria bacterium]